MLLGRSSGTSSSGTGPAVLMVLGSCTSLQFGASFAVQLFPHLGSTGVTTLRLGFAAVLLLAVTRPKVSRWSQAQWISVVLLGLSFAAMNGAFYEAIARIPLGPAVAIEFLGPLGLAAVLSRKLRDYLWILLALVGVAILGFDNSGGGLNAAGVGFVLAAGFSWAMYILATERVGSQVDGAGGLAVALVIGTLALMPFGASGAARAFTEPQWLLLALGTGLLSSVVPYGLELSALRILPKTVFGVLLALEPVIAAVAGWLLLDQGFGPMRAGAVVLVVIAGIGSALTASKAAKQVALAPEDAPEEVTAAAHP